MSIKHGAKYVFSRGGETWTRKATVYLACRRVPFVKFCNELSNLHLLFNMGLDVFEVRV